MDSGGGGSGLIVAAICIDQDERMLTRVKIIRDAL